MDIIVGAGVTGISYANFSLNDYLLLEAENQFGGYCKTTIKKDFVWDYSGHFFHFRYPEIKEFVCKNIDPTHLVLTKKHTQIYYQGHYIDFPFQSNIHQLPKDEFIDCLCDLFSADINTKSQTFKEYIYNNLGKSISEKFLIPYNEKLYATDLNNLDADAMGRFFPKADKETIVRNFRQNTSKSYNDIFAYPKGGAIEYINSLVKNIDENKIRLNSKVKKIDIKNKNVILDDGKQLKYDRLISTVPFPNLLNMCGVDYDKTIYTCNKVLVFNIGFDRPSKDKLNSWVYFPDRVLSFYRVGYYNNIVPMNYMSLYVELGFKETDKIPDENILLSRVISDLKKVGIVTDHQVTSFQSILMNPAYVHINRHHLADIEIKKEFLKEYDIFSIGRYGSWTYCSIEDNILEARELAKNLNNI